MANNRRPQNPKSTRQQGRERDEYRRALRAAGTFRPSGDDYRRKPKSNRWEDA